MNIIFLVKTRYEIQSNLGDTMKNLNENFTTEFLKYADEYNVYPLPRIVVSFPIWNFLNQFSKGNYIFLNKRILFKFQKNMDYRMSSISTISE